MNWVSSTVDGCVNSARALKRLLQPGILFAACIVFLTHIVVIWRFSGSSWESALSELVQTTLDVLCVVVSAQAAKRSRGFARKFWRLTTGSFSLLVAAEVISTSASLFQRYSVVERWTDILFLFWVAPMSMALFLSPDAEADEYNHVFVFDLIQAALFSLGVYLYFSYLPSQELSSANLFHSVWSRSLVYNGVLVGAFFTRSVLTNSKAVRSLFARLGLFLMLSSLADLYYSYPGTHLDSGDWYDLAWSSLLLLPIAVGSRWRDTGKSRTNSSHRLLRELEGGSLFPLIYCGLVLAISSQIAREHLALASLLVLTSFVCTSGRMFMIQRQQQRTAGALQAAENRCRSIVENALEGIFQATPEGRFLSANLALARMCGYDSAQKLLSGVDSLGEQVHVDRRRYAELKETLEQNGAVKNFEYEAQRTDGSRIWLSETARVVRDGRGSVLYYEGTVRDISERKRAETELLKREADYRRLVENIPEVAWTADSEGTVLFISEKIARIFGYTPEEVRREGGKLWFGRMHPDDRRRVEEAYKRLFKEKLPFDVEYRMQHREGHWMRWHDRAVGVEERAGKRCADGLVSDITERSRLEEQFRQAHKMEAVGKLAGGVAHDFNNLLMVIQGNSDVLLDSLAEGAVQRRNVDEIQKAARRAASLTRQLLAFSRMQVLNPTVLDLNCVVMDTGKMLKRLIGEDIDLAIVAGPGTMNIKADQGQIEQIIMNLAVNARDAMPEGGKLTIEISSAGVDKDYSHQHAAMRPGEYVLLTVTDSGIGMDAQTQAHIFEPFFTTKEQGKGTGLGLATVYGIVKQSGGWIWVYSEVGQGTVFKIYLPRVAQKAETPAPSEARPQPARGSETILLVEDQENIRDLALEALEKNGYRVLVARDGQEALQIAESKEERIDLLVSDVVMPKMGGPQLAERLIARRPQIRVLFMSGYAEHRAGENFAAELSNACLQKPFSMIALLHKVREVLEEKAIVA